LAHRPARLVVAVRAAAEQGVIVGRNELRMAGGRFVGEMGRG
jgi:hypothetical protein